MLVCFAWIASALKQDAHQKDTNMNDHHGWITSPSWLYNGREIAGFGHVKLTIAKIGCKNTGFGHEKIKAKEEKRLLTEHLALYVSAY